MVQPPIRSGSIINERVRPERSGEYGAADSDAGGDPAERGAADQGAAEPEQRDSQDAVVPQFNNNIPKAKADFEDCLSVTPMQDTSLVKVEFTYSDPEDCRTIVFDLISTHLENQRKSQTDSLLDRTAVLNNMVIKVEARLKDLRSDMRSKQVALNIEGGAVGSGGRGLV